MIPDLDVLDEQIARRVSEIEARDKAEQGSNLPERLKILKQNVTLVIVDFVRTGLFEKDKLTVVTLVTLNIMCDEGLLQREYVDIITRGRVAEEVAPRGQGKQKHLSATPAHNNNGPILHRTICLAIGDCLGKAESIRGRHEPNPPTLFRPNGASDRRCGGVGGLVQQVRPGKLSHAGRVQFPCGDAAADANANTATG